MVLAKLKTDYIKLPHLALLWLYLWPASSIANCIDNPDDTDCLLVNQVQNCLEGSWKGSLGNLPVMLNFFTRTNRDNGREIFMGKYYYSQHPKPSDLMLTQVRQMPNQWQESDHKGVVTGELALECENKKLTGKWTSPDGTTTLPLIAIPILSSYYQPRIDAMSFKATKTVPIGDHNYKVIAVPDSSSQTIQLSGAEKGIAKINQVLLKNFKSTIETNYECKDLDISNEHRSTDTMIMWRSGIVAIDNSSEGYCGGAHGYFGHEANIFNVKTGELEKIESWFSKKYVWDKNSKSTTYIDEKLASNDKLINIILTQYRKLRLRPGKTDGQSHIEPSDSIDDPESCVESVSISSAHAWPTLEGIVFPVQAINYVSSPCTEDVLIPYSAVTPFLSNYGKSRVKALQ